MTAVETWMISENDFSGRDRNLITFIIGIEEKYRQKVGL